MTKKEAIKLFEEKRKDYMERRTGECYFSIVDVVYILTDSNDYHTSRKYRNKLK